MQTGWETDTVAYKHSVPLNIPSHTPNTCSLTNGIVYATVSPGKPKATRGGD